MLLPALQNAREAARREVCSDNMTQFATRPAVSDCLQPKSATDPGGELPRVRICRHVKTNQYSRYFAGNRIRSDSNASRETGVHAGLQRRVRKQPRR